MFEQYYDINPIAVIDQDHWDYRYPEVAIAFRNSAVYTPLIDWTNDPQTLGVTGTIMTELLEPDVNSDEIPMMANYINAVGVDSRSRTYNVARYAGKVQLHKHENVFTQWKKSGGKDWRPILKQVLANDIVAKMEKLARNVYLKSPSMRWTYAGAATNFATIGSTDNFSLDRVLDWNFRLGNTGSPVIPGDMAAAKVAIIPPGVTYDIRKSLANATHNEAQMFRDANIYGGNPNIRYEIGSHSGIRFVENPNDRYGINNAVLYNCGAINKQWGVTRAIKAGDGAPDPNTTKVDDVWSVGQKGTNHNIQLESFGANDFAINDLVTIHVKTTSLYGVTGGVDPTDGTSVTRRVVAIDTTNHTLSFDRPIFWAFDVPFVGQSQSGAVSGTFFAYVTKARNIGMVLVLGSRGGVLGAVAQPLQFYEPRPVDDFDSIYRFTYDTILGHNVWEPNYFELHFCAVSLPKHGGIIAS